MASSSFSLPLFSNVLSSFSKVSFNNAEIAALALCLATRVALFVFFIFLGPSCHLKLVLPLFLYFLLFVLGCLFLFSGIYVLGSKNRS
jgi:hypothetical protein